MLKPIQRACMVYCFFMLLLLGIFSIPKCSSSVHPSPPLDQYFLFSFLVLMFNSIFVFPFLPHSAHAVLNYFLFFCMRSIVARLVQFPGITAVGKHACIASLLAVRKTLSWPYACDSCYRCCRVCCAFITLVFCS